MSNSLRPHEPQHSRPPCPSPAPRVYSNSSIESVMPSSHLILLSPSPPAPKPSQHQGLFHWVNSSHEVAKVLEFQLQRQYCASHPLSDVLYNIGTSVSLTYSTHSPTPPSCSHQGIPCIWDYFCLIKFVHFSWFLDFTYKWCQVVFVILWLISPSRFIHVSQTAKFHFYDWVIFHCICVCICKWYVW